jgi:DNA primase
VVRIELKIGGHKLEKVMCYYDLLEGDSEFKIVCVLPPHQDVNASLKINLIDGSFYCFGCGKSGNALDFVKYVNAGRLDELEACMKYFKILHSSKVRSIKPVKRTKIKEDNIQSNIEASDYYFGLKTINWKQDESDEKAYMQKRGFSARTLIKCRAKLNYSSSSYPIIFPMFDLDEFRGWVCRTTKPAIEKQRKYLYNEGFSRSNTLVGDYSAEAVVLVEGYMDRLKFIQFGVSKVAAILGWKITDQQIAKLKKQGVKYIISALDNDKCGRLGTTYLKKHFDNVIRFQFPDGIKDPGDMNQASFDIANNKTKQIFRGHKNGINR